MAVYREELVYLTDGVAVPDRDVFQLVVLAGIFDPESGEKADSFFLAAENVLRYAGDLERIHKNMLGFVVKGAGSAITGTGSEEGVYYLLMPEKCAGDAAVAWKVTSFENNGELGSCVFKFLRSCREVYSEVPAAMLRGAAERLWGTAGYVTLSALWRHLAACCGEPRLFSRDVLLASVAGGVNQRCFAYASGVRGDGRHFSVLRYGPGFQADRAHISGILVRPRKIYFQLAEEYCIRKAYALLTWFVRLLSPPGRARLGNMLGWMFWLLSKPAKKQEAVQRVRECLGVAAGAAWETARKLVLSKGRMLADVLYMPCYDGTSIDDAVEFEGVHHLQAALARGRGALLVSGHCGNWEMIPMAFALKSFPVSAVYSTTKHTLGGELLNRQRMLTGMRTIEKSRVYAMIKALKDERVVSLAIDQAGQAGVPVDFFGKVFSMQKGVAMLARKSAAPIVPVFISETSPCRYRITLHEPRYWEPRGDEVQSDKAVLQELIGLIEKHIRNCPHEWLWFYNPWKIKPPGSPVERAEPAVGGYRESRGSSPG